MSCAKTSASRIVVSPTKRVSVNRPTFMKKVIALIDAWQQAWGMRCAIRKRYPFDYE